MTKPIRNYCTCACPCLFEFGGN